MDGPFLHFANILYLASYSVRDILWLRILTVCAMLSLGWCYWSCEEYTPLAWQGIFLSINLFQIWLLVLERRPVVLNEAQKKLHAGPLRNFTQRQVQRFADKAEWCTIAPGQIVLNENERLQSLILLLSGEALVRTQGREIARLSAGHFAGEMSFLTGSNTTAEVIAKDTLLIAKWPKDLITELMHRDKEFGNALQAALGSDLVHKILRGRETKF